MERPTSEGVECEQWRASAERARAPLTEVGERRTERHSGNVALATSPNVLSLPRRSISGADRSALARSRAKRDTVVRDRTLRRALSSVL